MRRVSHITEPVDLPLEEVDVEAAIEAYAEVFGKEEGVGAVAGSARANSPNESGSKLPHSQR